MKYKFKYIIMKLQEVLSSIVRSKAFIFALITIILGFVLVLFSSKNKTLVEENFYEDNILEQRKAQREFTKETNISMSEINRVSKLLTFFFNDIIVTKNAIVTGISEEFEDINDYDMQIIKASKAGNQFEVTIIIAVPNNEAEELIYIPYKKYQIVITSTNNGLKVDYINILE